MRKLERLSALLLALLLAAGAVCAEALPEEAAAVPQEAVVEAVSGFFTVPVPAAAEAAAPAEEPAAVEPAVEAAPAEAAVTEAAPVEETAEATAPAEDAAEETASETPETETPAADEPAAEPAAEAAADEAVPAVEALPEAVEAVGEEAVAEPAEVVAEAPAAQPEEIAAAQAETALVPGQVFTGVLTAEAPALQLTLNLAEAAPVCLISSETPVQITLLDAAGQPVAAETANTDANGVQTLRFTLQAGLYRIHVASVTEAGGAFALVAQILEDAEAPAAEPVAEAPAAEVPAETAAEAKLPEAETPAEPVTHIVVDIPLIITTQEAEAAAVEAEAMAAVEEPVAESVEAVEAAVAEAVPAEAIEAVEEPAEAAEPVESPEAAVEAAPAEVADAPAPAHTTRIDVSTVDGKPFDIGSEIVLHATVEGVEPPYTLQWQYTPDGGQTVLDAEGANSEEYRFVLDEENSRYLWRIKVILPAAAE